MVEVKFEDRVKVKGIIVPRRGYEQGSDWKVLIHNSPHHHGGGSVEAEQKGYKYGWVFRDLGGGQYTDGVQSIKPIFIW